MSNCVEVLSTLSIPLSDIEHEKLWEDIKKYSEVDPGHADGVDLKHYCMYWFLGKDNVWVDDDTKELCINLGAHRSIHTWRDLQQTLYILGQYTPIKNRSFPMLMKDTDNNPNEEFRYDFNLEELNEMMEKK